MKKSNITGWKDVFSFTLIQTLKNKAYIISFMILLTVALISMPIIHIITSGGENESTTNPIRKVYVHNETPLQNISFSEAIKGETIEHIIFVNLEDSYDTIADRIEETENDAIILTITEREGIYALDFVKSSKGPIKEGNMYALGDVIAEHFEVIKINSLRMTDEQLSMIQAKIETKVSMTDINGSVIIKEDTSISSSEYWFIYGLLFIVLLINVFASTQIANSIVTEKSTRVIEYLLTSVKPLAIMVGKILAMLTAVLIQMITMFGTLFLSNKLTTELLSSGESNFIGQYLPTNIFQNITLINIIFTVILVFLGMIFYATLAGLAGATVSKLEEVSEGLMLFTFTNLIGAYVGLGAANVLMGSGINGFVTFSLLFPLSSPFILPGALIVGKASIPLVAAAIVLQVVFIILLFLFVARVYETLILHNGNKIKVKELIKISRTV